MEANKKRNRILKYLEMIEKKKHSDHEMLQKYWD